MEKLRIEKIGRDFVTIAWEQAEGADTYQVYWADRCHEGTRFRLMAEQPADAARHFTLVKSTETPHYFRVTPLAKGRALEAAGWDGVLETPVTFARRPQLEQLGRGLVAVLSDGGVVLSWRLLLDEVLGYDRERQSLTGAAFAVLRNGKRIAVVSDSTSYFDPHGMAEDVYQVQRMENAAGPVLSEAVKPWAKPYLELPLQKPAGGVTPAGQAYEYSANDMSVADVDGDGEYEFFVKWDPSNSHDVSHRGYTGHCYIDCYKLPGRLLWRLDMGPNIRAGAHYTQFMCYDFDGDGRAEMGVKTAPGTKMTVYGEDGSVRSERFITMPEADLAQGYAHTDNYVCSAADFREHLVKRFMGWQDEEEVKAGNWPDTLEACFGIEKKYSYPLNRADAEALTDYFLDVYAPSRSPKNELRKFEGFIYEGPEYLTMFAGDGQELSTIAFPFPREDDGLRWGDYAMPRIEPCNRVDRFLSGVAYLDGLHPSLIVCRGYYTRACIAAYDFKDGRFAERFCVDSGHVTLSNPFNDTAHLREGRSTVFGKLAGQGNHSISAADVDGDGCMELIYGGAVIDHDGNLLYSAYDHLPDGRLAKLGHGDAMHVAEIDPDRPGKEIFNVFEGAENAPYGFALRDAESGKALFGTYAEEDLGRCMVGDVRPDHRGLSCWVNGVGEFDCHGEKISEQTLGSNMSIRFAEDYSTQITDGAEYMEKRGTGVVNDWTHGVMLRPEGTATNNGTKGNPCLVADIFGDYREELLLRTEDSSAIRIYTGTEPSRHKLMTLMHDTQYRCGVAWQNNCYNQPVYPSFYYASDLDASEILPYMRRKPVLYMAGDSISQAYTADKRPQAGWCEYLLAALDENAVRTVSHRDSCPFEQERRYESRNLIVDDCAMGGRSSRSFREEERLADIARTLRPGDYLLIQFGHNDAAADKPERYVRPEDFAASLEPYLKTAEQAGATPVLLTPITLRPQARACEGGAEQVRTALADYAQEMRRLAKTRGVKLIDLFRETEERFRAMGEDEHSAYYIADGVHLTEKGAAFCAELVAKELKKLIFA